MAGLTPDEAQRIATVQASFSDATIGIGDSFGVQLMLALFIRITKLRDFAEQQQQFNQVLAARVRELEIRLGNQGVDANEVYLHLTASGDDVAESI